MPVAATLADPPRRVPGAVRTKLLFGGVFSLLGWGYLLVGSIAGWIVSSYAESPFASYGATAPGVIERVEQTSSTYNKRYIHRVYFHFAPPGGGQLSGTSYTTAPPREVPVAATIEYDPDDPAAARVVGMRARHFSALLNLAWLFFPLLGAVFAAIGYFRGRRSLRLLVEGRLARGRLVDKKKTMVKVNRRRVQAMTFEFDAGAGDMHRVVAKTHTPEVLEDEAEEALLFLPREPKRATLLDHLPGKPRIGEDGQLVATSKVPPWLYLIAPVGFVLVNLVFFLIW